METKYLIIMGILVLIICVLAGALYLVMTGSEGYERIEITSDGTTIEVPANQVKYLGDTDGVKYWNWSNGALVTYNSQEGNNAIELNGALGFYAIKELVRNGDSENIDGFTVYKLDADKLSDNVKTNGNGEFYCIHLTNETTHDNIVICCKDKDITLHMAKSVQYKAANTDNNTNNSEDSNLVNYDQVQGKVMFKISKLGTIITNIISGTGIIIIMVIVIISYIRSNNKEERRIAREDARKMYNIPKYKGEDALWFFIIIRRVGKNK